MKNVERGDGKNIPPTPTHSNLQAHNSKSKPEYDQEQILKKNASESSKVGDEEKQNSSVTQVKPSVSHPKVIDILDNQLEEL